MVTKVPDSEYETRGFCNIVWSNDCKDPPGVSVGGGVHAFSGTGETTTRCTECDNFACSECRVTIDGSLVCLSCAERRIEGFASLQSMVDHTTELRDAKKAAEAARVRVIENGVTHVYLDRSCPKAIKHDAHPWVSYWFGYDKNAKDNSYCPGRETDKVSTGYTRTWVSAKKDYSEDAENFPVSNPITVSQARKIAFDMHKSDKDKSGMPYSSHLHAVCKGVEVLGGSADERVAALFHDAVEDFHTTYDLLRKINVSEASITMIEAVSKKTGEEQGKYLARVIAAGPGAMRVKLADLLHNTRHDRIQALRDDNKGHTADRLLKKYRPSIAALMLELGIIVDVDEQKKLATKPIGTATSWSSHKTPLKKTTTVKKSKETPSAANTSLDETFFPCSAKSLLINDLVLPHGLWVEDIDTPEDGAVPEGKRGITFSDGSYELVEEGLIFNVAAE